MFVNGIAKEKPTKEWLSALLFVFFYSALQILISIECFRSLEPGKPTEESIGKPKGECVDAPINVEVSYGEEIGLRGFNASGTKTSNNTKTEEIKPNKIMTDEGNISESGPNEKGVKNTDESITSGPETKTNNSSLGDSSILGEPETNSDDKQQNNADEKGSEESWIDVGRKIIKTTKKR